MVDYSHESDFGLVYNALTNSLSYRLEPWDMPDISVTGGISRDCATNT